MPITTLQLQHLQQFHGELSQPDQLFKYLGVLELGPNLHFASLKPPIGCCSLCE